MMPGSLSIEGRAFRWTNAERDAYFYMIAVGLFAGLAVTFIRTPLHLPGHKVLLWMIPALAFRLRLRVPLGASAAATSTILSTLLLGGNLGGGWVMMPLVILAGVVLDIAARATEQLHLSVWRAVPLLGMAGLIANLICFVKRSFDAFAQTSAPTIAQDYLGTAASYAAFGLIAGVLGAICGFGLLKTRRSSNAFAPR